MSEQPTGFDDLAQFKQTFFEECGELLGDLEIMLMDLQGNPENATTDDLNAIFRAVHSIKGGAGAFGFTQLVTFAHTFETLLDGMREGNVPVTLGCVEELIRATDILCDLVNAAKENANLPDNHGAEITAALVALTASGAGAGAFKNNLDANEDPKIEASDEDEITVFDVWFKPAAHLFSNGSDPIMIFNELQTLGQVEITPDVSGLPALHSLESEESFLAWALKVTTNRGQVSVEEAFEFVEDDCGLVINAATSPDFPLQIRDIAVAAPVNSVVTPPPATPLPSATAPGPQTPAAKSPSAPTATSIRVDLDRVDQLVNMVGELVITQSMLNQLTNVEEGGVQTSNPDMVKGLEQLNMHTRELQESVMAIRMQPVKSVFSRMPRLVRELAAKLSKKVTLVTSGEETEVDKTVIEQLADPLMHMIRNSLDHGIEGPAERREAGKPELATVNLSAEHRSGRILIEVSDDGLGINRERVFEKATEKGLVPTDIKLSDNEIDNLIFLPGFSTAETVSDVSGRGVGMDVVRRNINNLGGRITVNSTPGRGSRFTMSLPLTLAVLEGMVVAVGVEKFVLPLTSIIETIRPNAEHVHTLVGQGEVLSVRGDYVPVVYLSRVFAIPDAAEKAAGGLVVLVDLANGRRIGIVVDELLGQQQVVIKSLEPNSPHISGISAATILGNGMVALILDIDGLQSLPQHDMSRKKMTGENGGRGQTRASQTETGKVEQCQSVGIEKEVRRIMEDQANLGVSIPSQYGQKPEQAAAE